MYYYVGRIYDNSYNTRTGVFLCQFWIQHSSGFLFGCYTKGSRYLSSWKIHPDYFRQPRKIFIITYYLILLLNCDLTILSILHLKFLLFFYVDIHGGRFTQGTATECYLRKLGEKGHTVQPISKLRADIRALCKISNTIFLRDLAAWVKP